MRARKRIMIDTAQGCLPIAVGFIVAIVFCLLLTLGSCRSQKVVEVERWQHDSVFVKDTVHVKDIVVVHDSVYITNTIQETVHDTVTNDVAWKYYTYDPLGNVTSLMDYTSSSRQGKTMQKSHESEETAVSNKGITHEEKASHSESKGTTSASKDKTEVKPQLSKWQKFIQGMGYTFLVVLALGIAFGGMRLYGKLTRA